MLRRFLFLMLVFPLLVLAQAPVDWVTRPSVVGRAWVVADVSSGQVLAAEKPDERFEPASLTKLMTAYIAFSAIKNKQLALSQSIPVSEKAWRAQGSRRRCTRSSARRSWTVCRSGARACASPATASPRVSHSLTRDSSGLPE